MTDATYEGEVLLQRWGDGPRGMTVTFLLDSGPDGYKTNPFKVFGAISQRFALVCVPINDDETLRESEVMPNTDLGSPHNTDRAQDGLDTPVPAAIAAASLGKAAALALGHEVISQDADGLTARQLRGTIESPSPKPKRKWHELPPSQQAAIACASKEFQNWCAEGDEEMSEDMAAACVRLVCGVVSRRELDTNEYLKRRWQEMYSAYEADTGRRAEDRS